MDKPLVISIIPARGGSKGVPKKNIKVLNGVPLIGYSIRVSLLSKIISRTIISTDSEEIASIGRHYRAEVPFLRPSELALDDSTDYEFVAQALDWFRSRESQVPDYLVHLRPTTPLRHPQVVDKAIEMLIADKNATALRSAHEMAESAYKTFEVENGYFKRVGTGSFDLDEANQARQSFPKTYQANGYVDVLRSSFVLENRKIHGDRVIAYRTPRVTEVDSLEEFEQLEFQIRSDKSKFDTLFGPRNGGL